MSSTVFSAIIDIDGTAYPVCFDPHAKAYLYWTEVGDEEIRAVSLSQLTTRVRIKQMLKTPTVAVEFIDPHTGQHGTATGISAASGEPTIRWDDNTTETLAVDWPLRPDTNTAELLLLRNRLAAARTALTAFQRENALHPFDNLSRIVREEQRKAGEDRYAYQRPNDQQKPGKQQKRGKTV